MAPTEEWMTFSFHLLGGELLERLRKRLDRALHVGLDDEP